MRDLMGMMGKVQEIQAKMEEMQEEMQEAIVEGSAAAGLVNVSMSGKGDLKGIKIDPSLFKEDEVEILEDLLITAHADAKQKAADMMAEKTAEITAGLPIPPGMKLPF